MPDEYIRYTDSTREDACRQTHEVLSLPVPPRALSLIHILKMQNPNIAYGGGLERVAAALNDDRDVFNTAFFFNAKKKLMELSGKDYADDFKSFRIILDLSLIHILSWRGLEAAQLLWAWLRSVSGAFTDLS